MKLKLDENLGERGADILHAAGHNVTTVARQAMASASDDDLIKACKDEKRCLVTLDLDFSNPFLYPPWEYAGIAVLHLPPKSTAEDLFAACHRLVEGLEIREIIGKLWIVQRTRIREYRPDRMDDEQ